jgi:hypothetical protein
LIILISTTCLFIAILLFQIVPLTIKSYVLNKSDLCKIDTVKLLDRAFYLHSGNNYQVSGIEFEDKNYKNFRITGSSWNKLQDGRQLYDTLQYNGLTMTILTDKDGYAHYFDKTNNNNIDVLGLTIADKSYIKLNDLNNDDKDRKCDMIIFFSITYCIFLFIHFYRVLKM